MTNTTTNSLIRRLLIGSLALVALFALAGSAFFFTDAAAAQVVDETETTPEVAPEAIVPDVGRFPRGARDGFGRRGFLDNRATLNTAIADALGITVEELEAARTEGTHWPELAEELGVDPATVEEAIYNATVAGIESALEDGTITQEQADAALAHSELKYLESIVVDRDVIKEAIAETLGITVDELEAARASGTPLSDLADAAGVTLDDVHTAAQTAREAMIAQAVADGVLTQEQADQLLAMDGLCGHGPHGGRGGFGRRGGPRDGGFQPPATTETADNA
jgi:predicted DNA-binding protein (UPF0251 family)